MLPARNLSDLAPWTTAGSQLLYMQQLIAGDPSQPGCAARLGTYVIDDYINPTLARLAALGPGEQPPEIRCVLRTLHHLAGTSSVSGRFCIMCIPA